MGLDAAEFTACVEELRYQEQIQADLEYGLSRGVGSTPSFFVNDQPLVGAQPIGVFNEAIATIQDGGQLADARPQAPPEPTPIAMADAGAAAVLGSADAPYTIVEFTNFGCDSCASHAIDTLPALQERLIDPGQVRYILKDLPGETNQPEARKAAVAARCAGEQDAYWEMHESLFATQAEWLNAGDEANASFSSQAEALNLDAGAFNACLESGQFDADIQANVDEARDLALDGYPYFIIEGQPLDGSVPNALAIALSLPMDVPANGAIAFGDPDAPITIIEFTDYQCPFCTRHYEETLPLLMENFVNTGKVYYVIRDFPLTSIHPQAVEAAEAARCAGKQGAYEEMHDLLFSRQAEWAGNENATAVFTGYAEGLGLDMDSFSQCLESGEMETAVLADMNEGASFGVSGTPAFFINGILVSGALPYESFEQGLNGMLADLEK
jgi:protein-disulfide isomerase